MQLRIARVDAIAVRRLDEDDVGLGDQLRIAEDRAIPPSEVAGEDETRARARAELQLDRRSAEDVPRTAIDRVDVVRHRKRRAVAAGLE